MPHFLKPYFQSLELYRNGVLVKHGISFKPLSISYNERSDCYFDLGLIEVGSNETVKITLQIEKLLLPFEEYPHDSSRGFDLPQMVYYYKFDDDEIWKETYVNSIVLMLPQPDFSMPFNVHALYCVLFGIMMKLYLSIIGNLS